MKKEFTVSKNNLMKSKLCLVKNNKKHGNKMKKFWIYKNLCEFIKETNSTINFVNILIQIEIIFL